MSNQNNASQTNMKGGVKMGRTLRLSKLKERTTGYVADDVKLKCFDNQCTVEQLQKIPTVETECPWDEYLYEVSYTFTHIEDVYLPIEHTVHYIVRGLTQLDRDIALDYQIELDIERFNAARLYEEYQIGYDSECLGKLIP